MDALEAGTCYRGTSEQVAAYPKSYLFYAKGKRNVKQNYCDSDTYVQGLGPNDAVKLRAFFYATQVNCLSACVLTVFWYQFTDLPPFTLPR